MNRAARSIAAALVLLAAAPAALAAPPKDFDARAQAVLRAAGSPGLGVAIVEKGKTTLLKGYGVRKLGAPEPVDADTIFPVASVSKAFTAAALGILVDQGKLRWDDKVIDHLPQFQMYDPWVAREITVRDLLVHRSGLGLGAGDLLFWPRSTVGRDEIVRRIRYLPPATSFRSSYAYDNVLYIVAGQVVEAVSGQSWETFVETEILKKAGMTGATPNPDVRLARANRAAPHGRINGAVRGLGDQALLNEQDILSVNAAPAGGLAATPRDLARWMTIQLAHGSLGGDSRLFSEAVSKEMWKPHVLMPVNPNGSPPGAAPNFATYALGWRVTDYRGHKIISHTGAIEGFRALVVLVPDLDVGFAFTLNAEENDVTMGLMYELLDHYIAPGGPRKNWPEAWAKKNAADFEEAARDFAAQKPPAAGAAARPLSVYAGAYQDPWFGKIVIGETTAGLTIDFPHNPNMKGTLVPSSIDTFRTVFPDRNVEPAYLTFTFDPMGKVQRLTLSAVSPLADFSYDYADLDFTPVR